jgi:hypothetical protein
MMQVSGRDYYWRLKPGTKGMLYWPGRKPTPVTFVGMYGVCAIIKGHGVRRSWHTGLFEGHLRGAFSWEVNDEMQN